MYPILRKGLTKDSIVLDSCRINDWKEIRMKRPIVIGFAKNSWCKDEDGYEITVDLPDWSTTFFYPENIYFSIDYSSVYYIWIREEKAVNEKDGTVSFEPAAIQLYPQQSSHEEFEIWFDLKKLAVLSPLVLEQQWYIDLMNKQYSGVQYMQTKER